MSYKTPGVYIKELSLFPPSVAQVETAIPAFIGYTEFASSSVDEENRDNLLHETPFRINSMLEYQQHFGKAAPQEFIVTLEDKPPYLPKTVEMNSETPYRLYYALELFFANGGGPCYIVSVGDYSTATENIASLDEIDDYKELKCGLDAIRKVDEITLIVIPEADRLITTNYYTLYQAMLMQCGELKDRFAILDAHPDEEVDDFRTGLGSSYLKYGACYTPYLRTSISYYYNDSGIGFSNSSTAAFRGYALNIIQKVHRGITLFKSVEAIYKKVENAVTDGKDANLNEGKKRYYLIALQGTKNGIQDGKRLAELAGNDTLIESLVTLSEGVEEIEEGKPDTVQKLNDALDALFEKISDTKTLSVQALEEVNTATSISDEHNDDIYEYYNNGFESKLREVLSEQKVIMPPSPAIAGVYAQVDNNRGVWKAPANISLSRVLGPSEKITHVQQESLNVHPTGKSINALRVFSRKGTLVWGARTLSGNDNEWRYISTRRFFNMVEESIKKATEGFVFEPNDANTWVKIKAMIENYLTILWRAGALMGDKANEAFFVKVGLGETMTAQDIFNGRLIIDIGLAAVRPAEFIILRFSHKLQES